MLPPWPYPFWIAHRGAGKLAPENTLAAFRLGAQHGYRMFECDVKLSADGVPFLLHDATLARTTNGPAALLDLPGAIISGVNPKAERAAAAQKALPPKGPASPPAQDHGHATVAVTAGQTAPAQTASLQTASVQSTAADTATAPGAAPLPTAPHAAAFPSATAGDHPWAQLAQLDAGGWHSRQFAGEPLPTLANLARWCLANGHDLDLEIKPTPGTEALTGRVVAEHAARLWQAAPRPPLLTSFQPEALQAALQTAPQLPRGLLLDTLWPDFLPTAQRLHCAALVCHHRLWDAALVQATHAAGLRCLSYTVNEPADAQRLIALGTDGVVTDRVDGFSPVGCLHERWAAESTAIKHFDDF